MANLIAIVGESGSGKSYSLKTLNPDESVIINIAGKPLPWRGWKKAWPEGKRMMSQLMQENKNEVNVDLVLAIMNKVEKSKVKNLIIDDFQYIQSFTYLSKVKSKDWQKFNDAADGLYRVVATARRMRPDLNVICLSHSAEKDGYYRMKTVGQAINNHLTLEGMFTVVLYTDVEISPGGKPIYRFLTQSGKYTTAKSPEGMFPEAIPNDIDFVIRTMDAYANDEELPEVPALINEEVTNQQTA